MKTYFNLLKTPGIARILTSQLTARFPFGMLSLSFLIHIQGVYGSYAIAGTVLAAMSLGQASFGPVTSRMMSNFGIRKVVGTTIAICCVTITAMAFLPLPPVLLVIFGFIAGATYPPIQPAVRTIYPKMVNPASLTPLFSLDAAAQEIIWIVGPVLATFVAIGVNSVAGIMVSVGFFIVGGLWFMSTPIVGKIAIPLSRTKFGGVLKLPTVIISTLVGMLLVSTFAAVEAGIVAVFGNGSSESGWVLASFAFGSLVGGLAWGHVHIRPSSLAFRLSVVAAGLIAAMMSTDFWWLTIMLFISGLGVAPALTVLFTMISATVKFSSTAESFAWAGSGQLIGAGLGSAVAGFAIDLISPMAAIATAAALGIIATICALIARPWIPDLRGRHATPIPDTASHDVV